MEPRASINSISEQAELLRRSTQARLLRKISFFDKVRVGTPPTQQVELYQQGATVTIRTKDGRTFSSTVFAPKGAGARGIDWADVDAKYRALVPRAQANDQQVEASLQVIHDFGNVKHVSQLTDLLHPLGQSTPENSVWAAQTKLTNGLPVPKSARKSRKRPRNWNGKTLWNGG